MSWSNKLAERQIAKARATGKRDHLQGQGIPLPYRPGDACICAGDAAGIRIMAEAGVLPEEIIFKKQATIQRTYPVTLTAPADRKAGMAELVRLEMRQTCAKESGRKFLKS